MRQKSIKHIKRKRGANALGLAAYKIRVTTVSNIVISCEFWETGINRTTKLAGGATVQTCEQTSETKRIMG